MHTRETLPNHDIAITHGRIACVVPDASYCIGDDTKVIEAKGRYMIPGLCDGHMHIESGMLTPAEFARAVIPHGTTSMFTDPHEIANVLGLDGVRLMHDEALLQPINVFTQMPSCAPSAPGMETTGGASADAVRDHCARSRLRWRRRIIVYCNDTILGDFGNAIGIIMR